MLDCNLSVLDCDLGVLLDCGLGVLLDCGLSVLLDCDLFVLDCDLKFTPTNDNINDKTNDFIFSQMNKKDGGSDPWNLCPFGMTP
ncbi:hypothetical protein Btru_012428, partial [Bulinus truncatus]